MSIKVVIEGLLKDLEEKVKVKEDAISGYRRVINLSKLAIIAIHRDEINRAKEQLIEAHKMLRKVDNILSYHQDLTPSIAKVAYQEYAEAEILLRLVKAEKFPGPNDLDIPTLPYLLGLADSIGEFRRRAIESLRKRKVPMAENCLEIMDEIYSELVTLENAHNLTPEIRRKCDIARRLIEITIGDIATAKGRISLEKTIRQFQEQIKAKNIEIVE